MICIPKACVFDLDGTLLDTLPDLVVLTNAALERCGYPPRTQDQIKSYVGNGVRCLMEQAVPEGTDQASVDEAVLLWEQLNPVYGTRLTKPYEGIDVLLKLLKHNGVRLAVLSNKFHEGTVQLIQHFFPGMFDAVYGVCDSIPRKPDPTGLLKVLGELGVSPEHAWYIGDSPGDAATARAAEAHGICVSWGYHTTESLRSAGAPFVVDHPLEIANHLL